MPDETIEQLTNRLSRTLTVSGSTSSEQGLSEVQKNQIMQMIRENMRQSSDPLSDESFDQPVGTVTTGLNEIERVPDLIRSLREFSGTVGEFNSWRKSVDRVLELYEPLKGTGRYYAILHTIRTKITGEADTALESYRTPLNWNSIKKCLMMHYSDKRDIGTLEYQMTVLRQGSRTITEFYQAVYQHLSLILDKVSCLELDENSLKTMTNTYREKALDTFVRGLNGDLPRLLSVREPSSLPQALHICLKLDNMTFRMNYAHGHVPKANMQRDRIGITNSLPGNVRKFYPELAHIGGTMPTRPPLPPRYKPTNSFNPSYNPTYNPNYRNPNMRSNIHQNSDSRPQPNSETQNRPPNRYSQTQYPNQWQNGQKPSVVEPMEVDRSIQTGRVNYMNRIPMNQFPKRPAGTSFQGPVNKMQRNFHIETLPQDHGYFWDDYQVEEGGAEGAANDGTDYNEEYFQQIPENLVIDETREAQPDDVQVVVNFLD